MLAIIAALSLMQAGEDMITRDELAAIADCASPAECLELIENSRRGYVDPPALYLTARTALRHFGMDAVTELDAWAGEVYRKRRMVDNILSGWPNTDTAELARVAELLSTDTLPQLPALPPADVPDALLPYLERLPTNTLARRFGYAARERLLMSYVPEPEGSVSPSPEHDVYEHLSPRLYPFLENPYSIGDAYLLADDWTRIAQDTDEPIERRAAALRGIRDLGPDALAFVHRIRDLEPDLLTGLARSTRRTVLDPEMADDMAGDCARLGQSLAATRPWRELEQDEALYRSMNLEARFHDCIRDLAYFGRDARASAHLLREFAASDDFRLQIPSVQVLGLMGDADSLPLLRDMLQAEDWQSVYAVSLAFRHVSEPEDVEQLRSLAATHWLGAVREGALETTHTMHLRRDGAVHIIFDPAYQMERGRHYGGEIGTDRIWRPGSYIQTVLAAPIIRTASECRSEAFGYEGVVVHRRDAEPFPPRPHRGALEIPFADGILDAHNDGEWGGELGWTAGDGPERAIVIRDNIVGVATADPQTLVVATGLAHIVNSQGNLYRVDWRGEEDWTVTRISTLPSTPRWLARLDEERFAVATAHGLIVFDRERIIGLGHCEPGPPAARN
ncbi:heat repeat-containing PBS lyase [Glycocaulis alkaliphilus]|uniref:Heat repeat-containing PBS lyase n=1 Tax=Glycocaulis alkaliphilus TaxID=1434191 RepID=A0A3T0ED22_9PROT|nr:HEAT repeat domain-containing protein [Glycocaulis alkaliphilus]AZU05181.1 heat repeat-containing PBS lyase [Glycocaulis alkaliphilus]GGB64597.1 hypothetical protein GCM10007417_00380 [Glycocaulis alkaliphilus]